MGGASRGGAATVSHCELGTRLGPELELELGPAGLLVGGVGPGPTGPLVGGVGPGPTGVGQATTYCEFTTTF